jgi:CrcB protein
MLQKIFLLALAGAVGTVFRYFVSGVFQKMTAAEFPVGTAAVNIIGCFLFALVWAIAENRMDISGQMRLVIFVGFFGAFTTFSSFIFETSQLLRDSQFIWAAGNFLLQNVLGFTALVAGFAAGNRI